MTNQHQLQIATNAHARIVRDAETLWLSLPEDEVTALANEFDYCTLDILELPFGLLPEVIAQKLIARAEAQ
jgi:hypothetical protein